MAKTSHVGDRSSLYSAPMVTGPTLKELEALSVELNLKLEGSSKLAEYQSVINDTAETLNELDELVEPRLPVKYPRTPGYRPTRDENPFNAWCYKSIIHGAPSGKLAGKRVAIKDSIAIAGIPMMIGCYALEGYVPDFDATVVNRILDEGGVILGKATCEELCNSASSHTSAGGPVPNPLDPHYCTGGSSSGSAVLVAKKEVDLSIGSDQGGSVRLPASWCGLVGLKPTYGLVPFTGAASREFTVDSLGILTRTVADCALALEVVAGYDDGNDARQHRDLTVPPYSNLLESRKLGAIRIAVLTEGFGHPGADPAVEQIVRQAIDRFALLTGAEVESVSIPLHKYAKAIGVSIGDIGAVSSIFSSAGAGMHHTGYYPTGMMKCAGALMKTNLRNLQDLNKIQLLSGMYLRENYGYMYGKAQNARKLVTKAYDDVLNKFDVVAMPTVPLTATPLVKRETSKGSKCKDVGATIALAANLKVGNLTGHPSISIPVGNIGALSVGLLLTAKKFDELGLLQIAHAWETSRAGDVAEKESSVRVVLRQEEGDFLKKGVFLRKGDRLKEQALIASHCLANGVVGGR